MKNLLMIITILLLVSCNKEEKQIYDKWITTETYQRSSDLQNWKLCDICQLNPIEVKITKSSWYPLVLNQCYIEGNNIIEEVPNNDGYTYSYKYSNDIVQFNTYNFSGNWISKIYLKRK